MISNATIYISDPSLVGSKLFGKFPEITKITPLYEGPNASGVILDLDFGRVQMNFMPKEELTAHINGLEGYVNHTFNGQEDDLTYLISRINMISLAIGMVIEPSFDEEPRAIEFLYKLNDRVNGLLFIYDSLVDYDGEPLCGALVEMVNAQ